MRPLGPLAGTLLALAAAAGCGDDDGTMPSADAGGGTGDGGASARVELGQGSASFVPIAATGASLELIMGPQGGWHVETTCRFWGIDPEGLRIAYDVREAGRAAMWNMTAEYLIARDDVTPDSGGFVRLGDRAVFEIASPSEVVGHDVTVRVCLTPASGSAPTCDGRDVRIVDAI